MAYLKEIPQNTPDNGVKGNYVKLVVVQRPASTYDGRHDGGILTYAVYLTAEARKASLAPMASLNVQPPAELWDECPPPSAGWDAIAAYWYKNKASLPGLEDAVDAK
jgi:hypothetical protein